MHARLLCDCPVNHFVATGSRVLRVGRLSLLAQETSGHWQTTNRVVEWAMMPIQSAAQDDSVNSLISRGSVRSGHRVVRVRIASNHLAGVG